ILIGNEEVHGSESRHQLQKPVRNDRFSFLRFTASRVSAFSAFSPNAFATRHAGIEPLFFPSVLLRAIPLPGESGTSFHFA
ncbi:MAG: hypothetical protein PUD50_02090, partial [Eubacteriales bacterium]|nr:hypothetical protein [Eubacteriales bacterium]